jgi:two-component system NtrC family response regulator
VTGDATSRATIHVLVAVQEEHRAQLVSTFLRNRGHRVACVRDGRAAVHAARDEAFDVAVLDIGAHEPDGLEIVHQLRADAEAPELIVITGNETGETAIGALRLGAYAHLPKPYRMAEIDVLVQRAWEKRQLARENRYLHHRLDRVAGAADIITRSAPMQAILALVERAAPSAAPILIVGETGTGKRLLAKRIHFASQRRGPFVEADDARPGEAALDADLFGGSGRGSAGAQGRRIAGEGLIELAAHGTLFLPNVERMPVKLQARLARALEHGSFVRAGGTQRIEITARLVGSAGNDLEAAAREERLHEGFVAHIRTITVTLPPLRERTADIPLLAEHFLSELTGGAPPLLSPDAMARLHAYSWPGNVSELRNVMERLVLTGTRAGDEVGPDELPLGPDRMVARTRVGASVSVGELERQHIEAVLERTGWHQGRAAVILGLSASTLYRKIRELGLERAPAQTTKKHQRRRGRSAK